MNNLNNFPLQYVYFLIFWITPIALIASYYVANLSKSKKGSIDLAVQDNTTHLGKETARRHHKILPSPVFINAFSLTVLTIFICSYVTLILYHEYFGDFDHSHLILSTLSDRFHSPPIWKHSARFWPFGMQEFNIISFLTKSPEGYHIFPVIQILIIIGGIFALLRELPIWFRACSTMYFFITPSTVDPFFRLVVPERNVIFWLVLFLVSFQCFSRTRSLLYFCFTLIAAHVALYYKEPVFLLIGGFAGSRLLLILLRDEALSRKNKFRRLINKNCTAEVFLLILAGWFIVGYYVFVLLDYSGSNYASARNTGISTLNVLSYYVSQFPLIDIFFAVAAFRFACLLLFKKTPHLFWDPLSFGAFLYFMSYIGLKLTGSRYMSPISFIAVMYLSYFTYHFLLRNRRTTLTVASLLVALVVGARSSVQSLYNIAVRKNHNLSQIKLYQFLDSYLEDYPSDRLTLFFPTTEDVDWDIMETQAFLEYKGLTVSNQNSSNSTDDVGLIFKRPYQTNTELCVSYRNFKCYYADDARSGNLIIVTPRFDISKEQIEQLKQEADLVYRYKNDTPFSSLFELSGTYVFRKP